MTIQTIRFIGLGAMGDGVRIGLGSSDPGGIR
jgi:hypothetical protein